MMNAAPYPEAYSSYEQALQGLAKVNPDLEPTVLDHPGLDPAWPIHVLRYRPPASPRRGLVVAGLHGDEPAGPWSVLAFLELLNREPEVAEGWELLILPLANPAGFELHQRADQYGKDLNRGFMNEQTAQTSAHIEALQALLVETHFDLALTLHEDVDETRSYLYSYERLSPSIAGEIIHLVKEYTEIVEDGEIEGASIENGIIVDHHDGSLEDWLAYTGATRTFCIETPAKQEPALRTRLALETLLFLLKRLR